MGYTGQYGDATTGLDYYHARYYDPALGQFASADTSSKGGLNRFGYVAGNPTTATDPSGHMVATLDGGGSSYTPTPTPVMGCAATGDCYSPPPVPQPVVTPPSPPPPPTPSSGAGATVNLAYTSNAGSGSSTGPSISSAPTSGPGDDPQQDYQGACGTSRLCEEGDDPNGLLDKAGYHHNTLIGFGERGLDLLISVLDLIMGNGNSSISSAAGGGAVIGAVIGGIIGIPFGGVAGFGVGAVIGAGVGWLGTNADVQTITQNLADTRKQLTDWLPVVKGDDSYEIGLVEIQTDTHWFLQYGELRVGLCHVCYTVTS